LVDIFDTISENSEISYHLLILLLTLSFKFIKHYASFSKSTHVLFTTISN